MKAEPDGALSKTIPQVDHVSSALRSLSNARRLTLLMFLQEPRYLEEIASHLNFSRQAASLHVNALQQAGFIKRRASSRPGKRIVEFVLQPEALYEVHEYFEQLVVRITAGPQSPEHTRTPSERRQPFDHRAATGPTLTIVHGLQLGKQFALSEEGVGVWIIGREARSPVRLPHDSYVSNRHAEIRRPAGGAQVTVADTFSRNGTLLNFSPLAPGEPKALNHGDLLAIGRTLLLFRN